LFPVKFAIIGLPFASFDVSIASSVLSSNSTNPTATTNNTYIHLALSNEYIKNHRKYEKNTVEGLVKPDSARRGRGEVGEVERWIRRART
jgi:hypothetical protein